MMPVPCSQSPEKFLLLDTMRRNNHNRGSKVSLSTVDMIFVIYYILSKGLNRQISKINMHLYQKEKRRRRILNL